jgi:hypothetical protein
VAFAAGVAALLSCAGARAEVKDVTPQGFTLENSETVPVDAMTAWKALVGDVNAWWPRDHTFWKGSTLSIEPHARGCFCEREGVRETRHQEVVYVDPGKLLRMTGALGPAQGMGLTGVLEFRFAPAPGGGTVITMYSRTGGYTPDDLSKLAPIADRVNRQMLGALAAYLRK